MHRKTRIEWPTLVLFVLVYVLWAWATLWLAASAPGLAIAVSAVAIAFHASLQHEAIHDHPFGWSFANSALAWPPLTLVIPYLRYRDSHLDHHRDGLLTDPFDDPESNFLDQAEWERLPGVVRRLLLANNTLAGRLVLGPAIGTVFFLIWEFRNVGQDRRVLGGWLWHIPAAACVLTWVILSPMTVWAYLAAVYAGLSLLRIRTFLEHRAHAITRARTVIIEDRGPLAFLFLNNNLHAVHHAHPDVAWYRLPMLYRDNRDRLLAMNEGYRFASYRDVFRRFLFHRKDPVAHPLTAQPRD